MKEEVQDLVSTLENILDQTEGVILVIAFSLVCFSQILLQKKIYRTWKSADLQYRNTFAQVMRKLY